LIIRICFELRNSDFQFSALLDYDRRAFGHHENLSFDATEPGSGQQARRRFVEWFVSQTETSVMHWHQSLSAQFLERLDCLFGIHVNLAAGGRVVRADGKQRDVNRVALADFPEPRK